MSPEEILGELTTILRDLLGDDAIVLTMATKRADVPGWDSFNYVTFMVAVESQLGVKFKTADVESFANVGAIVQKIIDQKKR
jgi:acyl carrier protein